MSKNQSFDDSVEINRRMDQLKKSLGIPLNKSEATLNMSEDTIFEKYIQRNQQSALQSVKKQDIKDLSNYLDLDDDRY